jgi:hypothetical protein
MADIIKVDDGFDWKVNLRKAGWHALYAALSVAVLMAGDGITHIHPSNPFFVVLIPPMQAFLKSLGNLLSQKVGEGK